MSRCYAFFFLPAAGCLPGFAQAQQPAAPPSATPLGSLTGTVLDSLTQAPVPYATVLLLPQAPGDKPITGVAADEWGHFALTKLTPGPARLRVSYVGYGTRTQAVTVVAGATALGPFRFVVTPDGVAQLAGGPLRWVRFDCQPPARGSARQL